MNKYLVTIAITTALFTGCSDQKELIVNAEHISNPSLHEKLQEKLPELAEQMSLDESGLLLTGNKQQVDQLLNAAKHFDSVAKQFHLIISNVRPGAIATNKRQIQLLVNKGHQISLGEQMLTSIPWQGYQTFADHNLISVLLHPNHTLEIHTSNTRAGKNKSFHASLKVEPERWYQLHGKTSGNTVSTNNEQLWVRLNRK